MEKSSTSTSTSNVNVNAVVVVAANNIRSECVICAEQFNKSTRICVTCDFCNFEACRLCCEKYLLLETSAKCMNPPCGKPWSRRFLVENFTSVFVNKKMRDHVEKVFLDMELALLPATQPRVEQIIHRENQILQIHEIDRQIKALSRRRRQLVYGNDENDVNTQDRQDREERRHFTRACPASDCRGYLSTQWKCGLCQQFTCSDCHVLKGRERDCDHTCSPEDLSTARLLDSDTKPCPKCAMGIFKINGCDMMFCTQCHTAFNWRTGRIEVRQETVHNPHYFEWLRTQNENGNGVQPPIRGAAGTGGAGPLCVPQLNNAVISTIRLKSRERRGRLGVVPLAVGRVARSTVAFADASNTEKIIHIVTLIMHFAHTDMPIFHLDMGADNNEELRIRYMRNIISEEKFKVTLQRQHKKREKKNEIYQIFLTFKVGVTEIIYRFMHEMNDMQNDLNQLEQRTVAELNALREYCNTHLALVSKLYSSITYFLSFDSRPEGCEYNTTRPFLSPLFVRSKTTSATRDSATVSETSVSDTSRV